MATSCGRAEKSQNPTTMCSVSRAAGSAEPKPTGAPPNRPIPPRRIMQISIAVQRMSLPSCSKRFCATRPKGRFSVNTAKYHTVSEQSGTALPLQQGCYACACSDSKEPIKRWSRIRVQEPMFCILKITASSLRKRLRKLWRATIGITPARHPRLLPQRRKKSPSAKNHGPRGKAVPGFLAARVYRERIIDRVCFRMKNHQSLRRRARRSRIGWITMLGAVWRALRPDSSSVFTGVISERKE